MGECKMGGAGAVYSFRIIGVSEGEGWRSCALLPGDLFLLFLPHYISPISCTTRIQSWVSACQ